MSKSLRNIIIAVAVIVLLIVGIVVINNIDTTENTEIQSSTEPIFTVYSEEVENIADISVEFNGETIKAVNTDGEWSLNGMNTDETDPVKVQGLVGVASTVTSKRKVEENPSDLAQYGLLNPSVTVNITDKDGDITKLLIGDKSPALGEYFIMKDGDNAVYTMYEFKVDTLKQPISYYQEFNRFHINIDDITGIKFIRKDETIELKIVDNGIGNVWSMITPYQSMANDDYIDNKILEPISTIELKTPVDSSQSGITDNSPILELTVVPYDNTTGKYDDEYVETLTVGKTDGDVTYVGYKNKVYAVNKESIGFVNDTAFNIVSKLQAFADISEVKSVTLEYGDSKHTLDIKNNDNVYSFTLNGKEAETQVSQGIYQSIIGLAVDAAYNGETTGETVLKISFEGIKKENDTVVEIKSIDDLNCAVARNGNIEFTIKKSKLTELLDLINKYAEEQSK